MPRARNAGQHDRGDRELCETVDDIRSDHHLVAWQAVGPDAPDEDEDELADTEAREDDSDTRSVTADLEDCERERHERERRAEPRDRPAREEEPEVAVAERREGVREPGPEHRWNLPRRSTA